MNKNKGPIQQMIKQRHQEMLKECKENGWPMGVYLYTMSTSKVPKINIRKGHIYYEPSVIYWRDGTKTDIKGHNTARFIYEDLVHPDMICGERENEVHSGSLWLSERDDEKALRIFITTQKDKMAKLYQQIEYTKTRISFLEKGGVIDGSMLGL